MPPCKTGWTSALAALPLLADDARHTLKSLQQAGTSVTAMANDIRTTTQRLSAEGGAIDQLTHGAQVMAAAADNFSRSTLPSINRAADETGRAVRQMAWLPAPSATTRNSSSTAAAVCRLARASLVSPCPWPTLTDKGTRHAHTLRIVLP